MSLNKKIAIGIALGICPGLPILWGIGYLIYSNLGVESIQNTRYTQQGQIGIIATIAYTILWMAGTIGLIWHKRWKSAVWSAIFGFAGIFGLWYLTTPRTLFDPLTGNPLKKITPDRTETFPLNFEADPTTGLKLEVLDPHKAADYNKNNPPLDLKELGNKAINLLPSPGPKARAENEPSDHKTVLVPVSPNWSEKVIVPWPLKFSFNEGERKLAIKQVISGKIHHDGPNKIINLGDGLRQEDMIFQFQSEEEKPFEMTVRWR